MLTLRMALSEVQYSTQSRGSRFNAVALFYLGEKDCTWSRIQSNDTCKLKRGYAKYRYDGESDMISLVT